MTALITTSLVFSSLSGICGSLPGPQQRRLNEQLRHAIYVRGGIRQVRSLLGRGADPNTRYWGFGSGFYAHGQSSTLLMVASALGYTSVVEALLDHRVNVNARGYSCTLGAPRGECDHRESTALIEACLRGDNDEIVVDLLSHGADVNARDRAGSTALSSSLWLSEWYQAKVLLDHGARANRGVRREISAHLRARKS